MQTSRRRACRPRRPFPPRGFPVDPCAIVAAYARADRRQRLGLMKPSAFLINTSRGPIVDEAAMIAALRDKRIAGAGLDVYDIEPLPADHPARALDNVGVSPHS